MENLDIDQDTAKKLLEEGCFFLLLEIPLGSSVGIDLTEYSVGKKFRGFKMIPPGLHFIHYSSVNARDFNQVAPRTGFFHIFTEKEVVIRKWDPISEDISEESISQDEAQRFTDNLVGSLDPFLAPYPFNQYEKWIGLTNWINEGVLDRLNPICGKIKSVTEMIPLKYPEDIQAPHDSSKPLTVDNLLPEMKVEPNSRIGFTEISKIKLPPGAKPSEITQHSIDSTYTLEMVMARYSSEDDILGELQFAFVTFIAGQVHDSFEHWKALLKLLCTSDHALTKYPQMYRNFIDVLQHQLQHVPQDLFVDIVDQENFLVSVLRDFFYNITSSEHVNRNLKEKAEKFKHDVTQKYEWDFDFEPEDECPVIVQLD